jgi:pyruvate/2-oxoglutarate dehydrogenase complex dihydrolipoamide acyltransferase (E2) component
MLASERNELITEVRVTDDDLVVALADGRTLSVPLVWYPSLLNATPEQRSDWELIGDGEGVHWPQIDEDLSAEGLLRGIPSSTVRPRSTRANEPREQTQNLAGVFSEQAAEAFAKAILEQQERLGMSEGLVEQIHKHPRTFREIVQKPYQRWLSGEWLSGELGEHRYPPNVLWQREKEDQPNATEAARRKAEELGVDLSQVEGSGSGGHIIVSDVVHAADRDRD